MSVCKSKQGRRSRKKGQEKQQYVARKLSAVFPFACSGSQYRGGKRDGCDVQRTPYFIEVKNTKTLSLPAWWSKMGLEKRASGDDREMALIFKEPGSKKLLVAITLDHFIELQRIREDRHLSGPHFYRGFAFYGVQNSKSDITIGRIRVVPGELVEDKQRPDRFSAEASPCHVEEELLKNPRKGSEGLWPTRDSAEAAIRSAWAQK